MSKNENKKKILGSKWMLAGIIVLVILAVAMMRAFTNKQEEDPLASDPQTTETSATESADTTPTEGEPMATGVVEFKNGEIKTPYMTLYYPEGFEDCLLVVNSSHDPYTLEFYAVLPERMEQRLFDVYLGAGSDGNLGVVATDKGEIPVSMTIYSFVPDDTWEKGEIDTVLAMQEATNELIYGLGLSNAQENGNVPEVKEPPAEPTIVNFLQIDTPYCVLQYPAIWADWLCTEQEELEDVYSVEFYCRLGEHEPLLMFTVLFGGDEGEQLGVVTNTEGVSVPVNILMNAPSTEGLLDEELEILYSMQEAMNYLIQLLPLQ